MTPAALEGSVGDTDASRRRALRLYDLALGEPEWSAEAVCPELGWTPAELESAVEVLSSLALLVPARDTPSGWAAVPIDRARRHLLAEADAQVAAALGAAHSVYEATLALSGTFQAVYADHVGNPDGHPVSGGAQVSALLDHAARGATTSLAVMHRGPCAADGDGPGAARARAACERGVAARLVCLAAVTSAPQRLSRLQDLASSGVGVRTTHALPFELLVTDRATAVVVTDDGPGDGSGPAAVVTHNQRMVAVLQQLFDHYWGASVALDAPRPAADEPWTSGRQRQLLLMLAAGLTDEAIGRKLGVSERTVRRLIAELSLRVGAVSRFQAGVNVTRLGWLDA